MSARDPGPYRRWLVIGVFGLTLLAACAPGPVTGAGGSAPAAAPAAPPATAAVPTTAQARPVTMRLDWLFQGPNAGFMVAKDKGYYEQAGLDVTIGAGQGSGSTAQLIANK